MTKLIYNKIIRKIEKLDEYLKYLKEIQKINKNDFIKDYHFFGLAERYLELSIQSVIDIGKLFIIEKNLERPETNQEIFIILKDNKIIPKTLINRLVAMAGFRNILAHEYEDIDKSKVYAYLQKNLEDFTKFKKVILKNII